jgi:hypothetical protein
VNHLPAPDQQPYAPQAGQTTNPTDAVRAAARAQADQLLAAVNDAMTHTPTHYRDDTPRPAIGTTPPVPQPGRAPMSQEAVDYSARVLSTAVASVLFSASGSGLLIASGYANPTTLGLMVAAPAILAIPVLALKSLMKSAKEVAEATPPQIHQHYSGHVYQDQRQTNLHTKTSGVIATTRNAPPPAAR